MMKVLAFLLITLLATFSAAETIKTYYPNGIIKSAVTYKDGKKNGAEHAFYPDGATLRYSNTYINGKRHGLQQQYNQNALLVQEESYKRGRLDGKNRYYHNGLLKAETEYKNGLPDGTFKEFFPSGLVKLEVFWEKGRATEGYIYAKDGSKTSIPMEALQILKPDTLSSFVAE